GTKMFKQLREAISNLDPQEVREITERPVSITLYASSTPMYEEMESFFAPPEITPMKRGELRHVLQRTGDSALTSVLEVYEEGISHPRSGFVYYPDNPNRVVWQIMQKHPDLNLSLARHLYPFRAPVVSEIIKAVSKENALFSLATAIPSILPFISLPWAVGEFASDTAFLTMNQVRMAFQIAGASDREIGYREQRAEMASLVAGAFGWRALARELVGHIPMGGGLIPKAAVAYAGTYVVGLSLERLYRIGYGYSRDERKAAYETAYEHGKSVAKAFLESHRSKQTA
ncbi:MAG: hypothetical protein ABI822_17280, partial [Bryobacteraceae bacterium]